MNRKEFLIQKPTAKRRHTGHRQVLLLSLALNAVLLFAAWRVTHTKGWTTAPPQTRDKSAGTHRSTGTAASAQTDLPSPTVQVSAPFHWSELESPDYRLYAANLRDFGCPESTVRDIIQADVNELFVGRVKDLVDSVQNRFWFLLANPKEMEKVVNTKQEELEQMKKERDALLKEVLGPAWRTLNDEINDLDRVAQRRDFLDFLPATKIDQSLVLDEKFDGLRKQLSETQPPLAQAELQRQLKELQQQQDHEFLQLLSPDEMAEFKLRNSRYAGLRSGLPGLDLSETELKTITQIDERYPQHPDLAQRQQQELELRDLLGDARFSSFERAQDQRYQEMYQLTDRLGLPDDTAGDAFALRKLAENSAQSVRANRSLSDQERNEKLVQIRDETEKALSATLGAEAFDIYRERSGQWLTQLTPANSKPNR